MNEKAIELLKGRLPNAFPALAWEAKGEEFQPEVNFTCTTMLAPEVRWMADLLGRYAAHVVAYFIGEGLPQVLCLELQFGEWPEDRKALRQCLKDYRKGPPKVRVSRLADTPRHQRLYRHRHYVLPDGTEFLYLGWWSLGFCWGKVRNGPETIENRVVPEDTLRCSRLIPKGEESFALRPCGGE